MSPWIALMAGALAFQISPAGHAGTEAASEGSRAAGLERHAAALVGKPVAGRAADAGPAAPDAWVAEDKLRHFALSFALTGMAYAGSRLAVEADPALAAAAVGSLTLGLGKELIDARQGGRFSWTDLAWDAAGVALGVALAERTR